MRYKSLNSGIIFNSKSGIDRITKDNYDKEIR